MDAQAARPAGPWRDVAHLPVSQRGSVFTDEITLDFADACATAAVAGLRFVDVRKLWNGFSHEVPRSRWPEMKQILADHGLHLGAIQSNFGKCAIEGPEYEEHIAFFPTLVEQAHYFGTDVIRVFPFWNREKFRYDPPFPGGIRPSFEAALPKVVEKFRPAAELARREGVWLGFEPEHSTYSGSPQEVARIVDAIDNPHIGVAWDVNNGWDDCSVDEAYGLFRGRIHNVHVKERTLTPDEHRAVMPVLATAPRLRSQPTLLGTGAMPWPDVISKLERDGYRGLYSIETHFGVRGPYGKPKLTAATTYFMYALRELLESAEPD